MKKTGKTFRGYSRKSKILYSLKTVGAVLVTLVMVFPLYWMLVTTFRPGLVVLSKDLNLLPESIRFDNYVEALKRVPLLHYIRNTIIVVAVGMAFKIGGGILAAYSFARGEYPGRDILFYVILGAMMVPHQVTFVPMYILCSRLGWVDTFAGLCLPALVAPHFIFMMRQSFKSVDASYIDAGKMDGLGTLGAIWYVMIPMCKSTLIAAGLSTFISEWNSYFWPKIITQTDKVRTVASGLVHLKESWTGMEIWQHMNVIMAGAVITTLPAIVLFFVFQKYMLTGYSKTSMK